MIKFNSYTYRELVEDRKSWLSAAWTPKEMHRILKSQSTPQYVDFFIYMAVVIRLELLKSTNLFI